MKVNDLHLLHLAIQARKHATKRGYLYKKSGKKNTSPDHSSVRWQQRWCTVYFNLFFYYENENSLKPLGVLFLEGLTTELVHVTDERIQPKSLFCIGIPGDEPHRKYLFRCHSAADCKEWLNAISAGSSQTLQEKNNNLSTTIMDLELHVQTLKDQKEKLRQELSDSYSQVSRLKLELSSVRSSIQRKSSFVESVKCDDSGFYSATTLSDKEYSTADIAKLIKLQKHIRSWLHQRRWKGLIRSYISTFTAKKLKRRNKLLWQFITAEEDYVRQMKVLVNAFLAPMKQTSFTENPCITNCEVVKIFTNSESILVLHKVFVEGSASRIKNWPAVHIDDLLFAIVAAVPIYIEYIKNHPEALKTLAECKKRSEFVKLLTRCEKKEDCHGQTLEQFLLYPVRVMPTYVRNIYEILKETPEDHIERKSLESILSKLQEAQSYNNYLDEGESIRHTLEIERLIDGGCHTLLEPNQKFIRHGVLKQIGIDPHFPSGKRDKVRHCFLFSEHLIIASRTADGRLRLSKQSGEIPLASTTLVEEDAESPFSDDVKSTSFTLTVNMSTDSPIPNTLTVCLKASKSSEKNLWTTDISQCIDNLALEDDVASTSQDEDVNVASISTTNPQHENEAQKESSPVPSMPYCLTHKDDPRLRENADDIVYGEELSGPYHLPQIMHASVDRLIERLADPRLPGAEFMETFLLTYRAFTTSEVVINGLIEAYWKVVGGYPSPKKKTDSPERKKLAVSRSISASRRHRTVSNSSDVSSTDIDLEGSFNSTISPYTSTTVFNYNTLKDQLNSPTKRKLATTKWCEDTAAAAAKDKDLFLRSASASNINADAKTPATKRELRKMSRSQSVEVLVGKKNLNGNANVFDGISTSHEFVSAVNSRSCDQLGDSVTLHDENKIHIISVSTTAAESIDGPQTNGPLTNGEVNGLVNGEYNILDNTNKDNSIAQLFPAEHENMEMLIPPIVRHRGSLLSEEISASEEPRLNGQVEEKEPVNSSPIVVNAGSDTSTAVSMTRTDTDMSNSLTNSEQSSSYINGGAELSSSFIRSEFMRNRSFRNREPSSSFTDHEMSTSYTNDDDLSRFCTNDDITPSPLSIDRSVNGHLIKHNGEIFENGHLMDGDNGDCIAEEVVDKHGNLRNRSSITSITDDTIHDGSGDPPSLDRISGLNALITSEYSDASTLNDSCFTERSNTLDSTCTSDYDGRRDTTDSQTDATDIRSGQYLDLCSLDRSTTMDSMNSVGSSDVSMNDRFADSESMTSQSVSNSHSDEMICNDKSRTNSDVTAKSSSLGEKKNSLTPYFRRRKKEKEKKEKEETKKNRAATVPKDEPVLISIRDTRGGHLNLGRSQSYYEEKPPSIESIIEPADETQVVEDENDRKGIEKASIPIPVPIVKVKKPSPDGTPRRKRSSFLPPFFKNPMKRSSSEQNIIMQKPASHGMRPAMSQMNLQQNSNASSLSSPPEVHSEYDTNSLDRLDRKKSSSFRDKLSSLTSSELDLSIKGSVDGKGSFKKEKRRLKGSLKMNNIMNYAPKKGPDAPAPARRKTSVSDHRPQMVARKSVSVNRGPLKIMSIFKHWLAKHPKDFVMDPKMLATLDKFFADIRSDVRTLPVVKEIVSSLEKSLNIHRQSLAAVHPFDELLLQQHSLRNVHGTGISEHDELNRCTEIHNYPPSVVAGNMTLLEHYLYAKISFNEFVSCQWTKKDKETKAPGIMKFIKRFNQVTSIISYSVVHGSTPEKRASMIEFWIRTAAHCRDLNNFNAIVEIISALNASAVHRLKKSWELVSKPFRDVFSDLDTLVSADRSFKNLREAVHMCNPPCVPYLGCYLSDLLFAHEGGSTFNENGLVNHAKMCRVSRLVREVKCYQQLPYTIELNKEVAHSLVNWNVDVDLDLLYDQSLLAEPRGS